MKYHWKMLSQPSFDRCLVLFSFEAQRFMCSSSPKIDKYYVCFKKEKKKQEEGTIYILNQQRETLYIHACSVHTLEGQTKPEACSI